MAINWLIIAVLFFVGELICPVFFLFWFSVGALVAMLLSLVVSSITVQIIVFLVVSVLLLIFMKPLTNKLFKNKEKDELNTNGIIGKTAVVVKEIDNLKGTGEVKVGSELWRAVSDDDSKVIPQDAKVTVLKIDGVKVIVKEETEQQ